MKKDLPTFIVILLLFLVSLSGSIYGFVLKFNSNEFNNTLENTNKDFYFNGSLYFYSNEGELLGNYDCLNEDCGYIKSDDENFINYYYESAENIDFGVINDSFVFLQDGDEKFLYAITLASKILTYEEVKYYDTFNTENYILVKYEGYWGAVSLSDLSRNVEFKYDELSLADNLINNELDGSTILAKLNGLYYLIDNEDNIISESFSNQIVYYNTDSIVTYDETYNVYDYNGNKKISYDFKYFDKTTNYFVFVFNNYLLVYDDLSNKYIDMYTISDYSDIRIEEDNSLLSIYIDGILLDK